MKAKKNSKSALNITQPQLELSFYSNPKKVQDLVNKANPEHALPISAPVVRETVQQSKLVNKHIDSEAVLDNVQQMPLVPTSNELVFSVSEISAKIKGAIENNFSQVSVKGEVSGLKRHTSGHYYFVLKDANAAIDAVCWRGTPLGVQLEEGIEIVAKGRVTTYPGRSKYQMIVEKAEISGEGALLKLLHERKLKLQEEGLFARKRPLPAVPKCIGVITSPTGAVIRDILHRITERFPCQVIVWPVLVQGPGAAEQIAAAIEGFNKTVVKPDVLIVARGGGSIEDLWAFNEEVVVRAAASSNIPLISAVGHETDTTLIDFAADVRAPTPTAAAEIATPVREQIILAISKLNMNLQTAIQRLVEFKKMHLASLAKSLPDASRILEHACIRFDDWCERLITVMGNLMHLRFLSVQNLASRIPLPHRVIEHNGNRLNQYGVALRQTFETTYREHCYQFSMLAQRLEMSSYQRSLERGFCYIECGGQAASGVEKFKQQLGSPQTIHFHDGLLNIIAKET